MELTDRQAVIEKITQMQDEQVLKVLIFMAGMEAGMGARNRGPGEEPERDRRG